MTGWQKFDDFMKAREREPYLDAKELRRKARARYWREIICDYGFCTRWFDPRSMTYQGGITDPDCHCNANKVR